MKADGKISQQKHVIIKSSMNPWTCIYITADCHYPQAYSADMLFPRYVWITYARDFSECHMQ